MKVLFVAAGDGRGEPKDVVRNQGNSLSEAGIEIVYFCVGGSGIKNYARAIPELRKVIRKVSPDIVHAHYSYSGFLARLAGASPLVVSLMGSDVEKGGLMHLVTRCFAENHTDLTIVKSSLMKESLHLRRAEVIPNGVNVELFSEKDRIESCKKTGMNPEAKNILFVGNPGRREKNFDLARIAVDTIGDNNFRLVVVNNTPHEEMVWYYNSADLLLLPSLWEGSPNAVKEAMACNLPVIASDVGDVKELLGEVKNSWICKADPSQMAERIKLAVKSEKSNGREKLLKMGLDSKSVALRIKSEYHKLTGAN